MEGELGIKVYKDFINDKMKKYKKHQRKIWDLQYEAIFSTRYIINDIFGISTYKTNKQIWFDICLWEFKYIPSYKMKMKKYEDKLLKKIQLYYFVLNNINHGCKLNEDIMLSIIQYIF